MICWYDSEYADDKLSSWGAQPAGRCGCMKKRDGAVNGGSNGSFMATRL